MSVEKELKADAPASSDSKKKSRNKKIKKLKRTVAVLSVMLVLCIVIILVLVFRSKGGSDISTSEYEQLEKQYNELLVKNQELAEQIEDLSAASTDDSLGALNPEEQETVEDRIRALEETIEANAEMMAELGLGDENYNPDPALLSEAYIYTKTKWNLLENYSKSDSGSQITTEFIRVNPKFYYCAYVPSGNVSITYYSEDYASLGSVKDDASNGFFFTVDDKSYYMKVSYPSSAGNSAILVSTGINKTDKTTPLSRKVFYVVSKNSPVSLSPSAAVNMVVSGGTVLILPGTYNDQISAQSKSVNLLGVGSSKCIIQSYSCDYYTPPLEIAAGTVSNLSFYATNSGSAITELKAYAVHIDYDYSKGRSLTISNCVMSSDFNAGVGIGLRGGGTLKLSNCTISGVTRGIFLHDCDRADFGGNQSFIVESCNIKCVGSGPALHLHSQGMSNANVSLTFTNNSLGSSVGSSDLLACTNQNSGIFDGSWNNLENYHLVTGYGNNVSAMNQ